MIDILRVAIGALCVFFAHFAGRSSARVYRGQQKSSRLIGWLLRTLVAAAGVFWRHGFDRISVAVAILLAGSFAAGAYEEWRPKRREEPPKIVPDE